MGAIQELLLRLADACVTLSTKITDAETASELLKISNRLLQLADPHPSVTERDIVKFNQRQMFGTT